MSSTGTIILQSPKENNEQFFDHSQRQAVLRELEEQFHLQLTERDVFRAASLFFALLADGAFVNKEFIIHEVQRRVLSDTDFALEAKKDPA